MGRGRAKAKQQKVARRLKYNNAAAHTDLDRLRSELGVAEDSGSSSDANESSDDAYADPYDELIDRYADLADQYAGSDGSAAENSDYSDGSR